MLNILYRDEFIVAVQKPAGMLVHKSLIDKRERVFLLQTLRDQIGCHVYPLHRLDKPTSGVVLFALSSEFAARMGYVFEKRLVHKTYVGVLRGFVPENLQISYPLKERLDKKTDYLADVNKNAQEAVTDLYRIAQTEIPIPVGRYQQARFSLVKLVPLTGRKHQLRRHMAHIRHPIIGDTTHGDGTQNRFARKHFNFTNLALTAIQLQFFHPFHKKIVNIKSEVPDELNKVLELFEVDKDNLYSRALSSFNK